jgi:hypothetical protein
MWTSLVQSSQEAGMFLFAIASQVALGHLHSKGKAIRAWN